MLPPRALQLCSLLNIDFPLIQAGMVWVSGGKLAGLAAQSGILGVVGAASMTPELLAHHLKKAISLGPIERLAVNIPLLYRRTEDQIRVALDEGIRTFITSAGSPKTHTPFLKKEGCRVLHVISSPLLAKKCEDQGVDGVIAEGFEAGGHNGRDESTTFVLVPQVCDAVSIPVIAAGGIADGRGILAGLSLGAAGVQMGTRFLATMESSAHENFKNKVIASVPGDTFLCMKKVVPVRLMRNTFYDRVKEYEDRGASSEELSEILGHGRAKQGMHLGDLNEGELEVGQICSMVRDLPSVSELVERLKKQYEKAWQDISGSDKTRTQSEEGLDALTHP